MYKKFFKYKRELHQNPYTGFTSFQHFRNDELYSDLIVKPENNMTETEHVECYPVPDYVEEKGRAQGYYPDCSIVYIRILWKEFEPLEGDFNYQLIDKILARAKECGQTVMFRLLPHSTRESDDVPDWVKSKIACPARPLGQRVKTSPSDPKFLILFGNAIRAFAKKFDDNKALAFMDVSLPGAWGEGSSIELFTEEQIKEFADIYTNSFKNTQLIGQVVPWVVHYMNEKGNVGWRADCIGRPNLMQNHLPPLVEQMSEVYKRGHVSFEAYWWLGEWQRQGWDLDDIIQTTLSWHISSFNAKSLPIPYEWKDKVDEWVAKMGYHFVIDSCQAEITNCKIKLKLVIDNVGVAPIYKKIPVHFAVKNGAELYDHVSDIDITTWMPGKTNVDIEIPLGDVCETVEICVGIFNEDTYVYFASDAEFDGKYYQIAHLNNCTK